MRYFNYSCGTLLYIYSTYIKQQFKEGLYPFYKSLLFSFPPAFWLDWVPYRESYRDYSLIMFSIQLSHHGRFSRTYFPIPSFVDPFVHLYCTKLYSIYQKA